jgi:hypothetical protein
VAKTLLAAAVCVGLLVAPGKTIAVIVVLAVAVLYFKPQGRTRYGSGDGFRAENAVHEAGHVVIARRRGAGGVESKIKANGKGWTEFSSVRSRLDSAVILAGGSEAANLLHHRADHGITAGDGRVLRIACRQLGVSEAHVRALARDDVRANQAAIEAVARQLDERGHL